MKKQTLFSVRFRIRLALTLMLCTLVLAIQPAPVAHAATITANSLADTAGGSECTLRNAITAANTNTATGGCPAGAAGADTINFSVSGTITLTSALPAISQALTIDGPGAESLTVSGNNLYRVLYINDGVSVTISGVTIANGYASWGGGIFNDGTLTVDSSTFSNNRASSYGGGIGNYYGTLTVTNSTFSNNTSNDTGGGLHNWLSTATVSNSVFSGNQSVTWGGGIVTGPGSLDVTNSTFSGNFAGSHGGGGIANSTYSGSTIVVVNSTFSGNRPNASGSGVANGGGGAVTLKNTIVANSAAGSNCSGTITNGGGNLVWGDTTCPGINADPKLDALANNGGSTQTMKLGSDSAAIDTAVPANCPAADQRGQSRDDYNCDIGAFELKLADSTTVIKAVSGTGTYTFGPTMVKVVISTLGSLSSLTVTRTESNHPNATTGLQTGRYWTLTPTGCGSNDCAFNLTLPTTFTPYDQDKVCRYTGSGQVWDCAMSSYTSNSITRNGVTSFSDWAAGNNVGDDGGPTAVTLRAFTARSESGAGSGVLLLVLLALGVGGLALVRWARHSCR